MARLADRAPALEVNPWRPSVSETVEHNRHTQCSVPYARAQQVAMIRFGQSAGLLLMAVLAGGAGWLWYTGNDWPAVACTVIFVLLVCLSWAARAPFAQLVEYQMREISDPYHDSEWRELARMQADNAQPPAPVPCVRVESVVREPGRTTMSTAYNDELPGTPEQWRNLAELVLRDPAPEPFSLRTAESVGLSREQWNAARDVFIARGWAGWNHPTDRRQGITLRLIGRRALRTMAEQLPAYQMVPTDDL